MLNKMNYNTAFSQKVKQKVLTLNNQQYAFGRATESALSWCTILLREPCQNRQAGKGQEECTMDQKLWTELLAGNWWMQWAPYCMCTHQIATLFWNDVIAAKYDVISEIRLCQSMLFYLKNNRPKFHLHPVWHDSALGFPEEVQQEEEQDE